MILNLRFFYGTSLVGQSDGFQAKAVMGTPDTWVTFVQCDTHCGGVNDPESWGPEMGPHSLWGLEGHEMLSTVCDL